MSVETPIVRVFRGETWLTVYRSVAVRNRLGTPMGGTPIVTRTIEVTRTIGVSPLVE